MWIEPAAGGGYEFSRYRPDGVGIFCLQTFNIFLDAVLQLLRGRSEIGAGRVRCVIAFFPGGGRPWLKVGGIRKSLSDQFRAYDLTFFVRHETAVGSPRKKHLRESGHHERIDESR